MIALKTRKIVKKIHRSLACVKMKKRRQIISGVVLMGLTLLILAATLTTSCSVYRHYTFENLVANCKFEYPNSYQISSVNEGEHMAGAWVILVPKSNPEGGELILILAKNSSEDIPDYRITLERALQGVQKGQNEGEFNLDDRSKLIIDNTEGEQIIYHFVLQDNPVSPGKFEPFPAVAFEVYFQKDNVIWSIWAYASTEKVEQTKINFNHLVESFKFVY